jgi:type II secretory pathway predicted ATPase ExeA
MVSEALRFYGLRENPFRLDIDLNTFVDYEGERELLLNAVENGEKIILLLGPTGAGKTTLMLWLRQRLKNSTYFPKPPSSFRSFQKCLFNNLSLLERLKLMSRKDIFTLLNLKRQVLLIDEATFISDDLLEWIKVLADQTKASFILAGLFELEERIINKHRTLYERITTKVRLERLCFEAARNLIISRLRKYGGENIFEEEALEYIYRLSGGFPRNILKLAYECLLKGYELKKEKIDSDVVSLAAKPRVETQISIPLTGKQRDIVEFIIRTGAKSSRDIYKYLKEKYPTLSYHAVSVLLKRMVDNGYLVREKNGNSFVYDVSTNIKNLIIRESL